MSYIYLVITSKDGVIPIYLKLMIIMLYKDLFLSSPLSPFIILLVTCFIVKSSINLFVTQSELINPTRFVT